MSYAAIDILAIGAHPDDAEAGAGDFACVSCKNKTIGIICVSDGGGGAHGTSVQRIREAGRAAELLELDAFEILGQEDTHISAARVWVEKLEQLLVAYRPKIIITHSPMDWHPDHRHTWELVDAAWAHANRQGRHGANYLPKPMLLQFSFDLLRAKRPALIVDISPWFVQKKNALAAHTSQTEIIEKLIKVNEFFGSLVGTEAAEAFFSPEPIVLSPELSLL